MESIQDTREAPDQLNGEDWRWRAIAARDGQFDGVFVFAVRSTGVFCRPSCPSRRPKPENVVFFDLNRDAEAAGFRPCKRCRPLEMSSAQKQKALIEQACRLMETAEEPYSLPQLGAAVGLSPHHLHRQFKKITGVTPKAYAKALRERRVAASLQDRHCYSVTEAIYSAGYQSATRFYDGAKDRLGMMPRTVIAGGEGENIYTAVVGCWLGKALIAATDRGVCAVRFGDDADALLDGLRKTYPNANIVTAETELADVIAEIVAAIEQPVDAIDLPLDIQGTLFQQKVWAELRRIPAGETRSYAQVAAAIGAPKSARAVGTACGANPVAIITPCHRCLRGDGGLGGYRWGVDRKSRLLAQEAAENPKEG